MEGRRLTSEEVDWLRGERLTSAGPYLGDKVCTLGILRSETLGLDRQGFRALVREKLQALGDELLRVWEAENG